MTMPPGIWSRPSKSRSAIRAESSVDAPGRVCACGEKISRACSGQPFSGSRISCESEEYHLAVVIASMEFGSIKNAGGSTNRTSGRRPRKRSPFGSPSRSHPEDPASEPHSKPLDLFISMEARPISRSKGNFTKRRQMCINSAPRRPHLASDYLLPNRRRMSVATGTAATAPGPTGWPARRADIWAAAGADGSEESDACGSAGRRGRAGTGAALVANRDSRPQLQGTSGLRTQKNTISLAICLARAAFRGNVARFVPFASMPSFPTWLRGSG